VDDLRPKDSLFVPFLVTSLGFLRVGVGSGAFELEESESELEPDEEEDEGELLEEDDERVELGRFVGSDGFLGVLLVGLSVIWSTEDLSIFAFFVAFQFTFWTLPLAFGELFGIFLL